MSDFPPLKEPSIHQDAFVADTARVFGDVTIGADASVWFGASIRAEAAPVTIAAGANVQDNAVLHTDTGFPVVLGANVTVGHGAIVHGAIVERDALVGMGAILLNGAVVEQGAFVAAGCVVPPGATVPAAMLAVGSPMRIIRAVNEAERAGQTEGIAFYKHYARLYAGRDEGDTE